MINIDEDIKNADWPKQTKDWPIGQGVKSATKKKPQTDPYNADRKNGKVKKENLEK